MKKADTAARSAVAARTSHALRNHIDPAPSMEDGNAWTPGPWRVAPVSDYVGAELNVDARERGFICLAGVRGDREAEANARLIASAPDLLAALEELDERLRKCMRDPITAAEAYDSFYQGIVEDAIKKAKGIS